MASTDQFYIALLRGINVSGSKIIRMEDLKKLLIRSGFERVTTYIQSGNLVFQSPHISVKFLALQITNLINDNFGYRVPVLVKTEYSGQSVPVNPDESVPVIR
jgi:uncharacterized protein (DUF1697 family)